MYRNKNKFKNDVIVMDNTLAESITHFSLMQQKIFYVALTSLKDGLNENDEVEIDKQELFKFLGMEKDHDRYTKLKKEADGIVESSSINFGDWWGSLIRHIRLTRNTFYIAFNDFCLPLLYQLKDKFVRLLDSDLVALTSKRSMMLYQNLMKDKWKMSNADFMGIDYSTKELKKMFGLPNEAYVSKNGHFNRADFERGALNKTIEEINSKCKCIKNLKYEKVKKNGRVQYYKFSFDYTDPQSVADESNERKGKSIIDSMQKQSEEFSEETKNLNWWEE